ncbi:MAG: hypothetical protein EBU90_22775 [Proteobacteria bacterium]|nr:hypothetical protein [Pseudomonadota bacterium]
MLITFDHVNGFGKITHQDFVYSNPEGTLEKHETPDDALRFGWIPWKGKWYNHRSVRINLAKYHPSKSTKKDYKKIESTFKSISEFKDYKTAEKIYNIYCKKNNFNRNIPIKEIIDNSSCFFEFRKDNQIKGYTFSILHEESLVSLEFIQDFTCHNISLGSISQHYECLIANSLNRKYVYLLGGYETSCLYKCKFYGMEWWTGKEWIEDRNLFIELCQKDDTIKIEGYDNNF